MVKHSPTARHHASVTICPAKKLRCEYIPALLRLLTGEGSMLVDSQVHHNSYSIKVTDDSVAVRGNGNTTLGSGAVMSSDASLLQAENEHLRDQLKTKDDQIAALQKIIDKLTS